MGHQIRIKKITVGFRCGKSVCQVKSECSCGVRRNTPYRLASYFTIETCPRRQYALFVELKIPGDTHFLIVPWPGAFGLYLPQVWLNTCALTRTQMLKTGSSRCTILYHMMSLSEWWSHYGQFGMLGERRYMRKYSKVCHRLIVS